jgi:peptide methionine sulfoxide reductase MsrA
LAYWWIDGDAYRKSTAHMSTTIQYSAILEKVVFSADYHQQYLAKNPDGYCPNHSCGVPYKSPESAVGEQA